MKQTLTVLLCALLCACGTTSTLRGEQQTDYVLASFSQAGGAWKLIRGKAVACKLSSHGTNPPAYTVELTKDGCVVRASK
jgi:hypothetical protein